MSFFFLLDVGVVATAGTPPLPHRVVNRATPPTPSKSQERRGSLPVAKHPPVSSKADNMVSYEDMIRNSPRSTPKATRNKAPPQKTSSVGTIESNKLPPSGEASPKVVEGVKLRQSEENKIKLHILTRSTSRNKLLFNSHC